jgi:sugar/nucleoside kinase (ribokinase family)
MKKILGIGNALVDVLIRINDDDFLKTHHLPKGSMQLVDFNAASALAKATNTLNRTITSGGSAANTVFNLSRLGAETAFIGKIGNDEYGKAFSSDLRNHNVSPRLIIDKENKMSGFCTVFISPDGERTMATHLGVASELNINDISEDIFKGYDILHVEGYLLQNIDLIYGVMKMAKKQGLKISLDFASYNIVKNNRDFLHSLIDEFVDIAFANEEEATTFSEKSVDDSLPYIAEKTDIAVVKIGSKGSLIMQNGQKEIITAHPANCVDTTGAGDMYASGFLYGYAKGYDLQQCGTIGSYLAAQIVEEIGPKFSNETWIKLQENGKELLSSDKIEKQ